MAKRTATTDLNHDNWNEEMEKEEPGEFKKGSAEELKTRVFKTVKRRLPATNSDGGDPAVKSAFSQFTGFGNNNASFTTVGSSASPFSFLSKMSSVTSTVEKPKEDSSCSITNKDDFKFEKSTTYYEKLKELNIAVTKWIKQHVDQNPVCILTPIFDDYAKYLKELGDNDAKKEGNNPPASTQNSQMKNFGGFSFGANNSIAADSSISKDSESSTKAVFRFGNSFGEVKKSEPTNSALTFNTKPNFADTTKPGGISTGLFSGLTPSFTFGKNVTVNPESTTSGADKDKPNEEDEDEEPPKPDFKQVVEEDSIYSKKCKVFFKNGKDYADRGIGTLHLKPVKDKDKTQFIVRADTSLGNIILNVLLMEGLVVNRVGKNNVMMVGILTPDEEQKITTALIRVKNGDEADDLLKVIKENIK